MPTPYERVTTAEPDLARRTLVRPREGRLLAGVCAGIAKHLGVPVIYVRAAMVLLTFASGAGIAGYIFVWAMTQEESPEAAAASDLAASSGGSRVARVAFDSRASWLLLAGGLALVAGAAWGLQLAGVDVRANVLLPMLVIAVGAVIAWSQLDEAQRGRWLGSDRGTRSLRLARLAFGFGLAILGLVVLVTRGRSITAIWDATLATVAVLAGAVMVAAPWAVRLWTDLRREQEVSARANERADIAAHLHDSVLQTLALIQRQAGDATAVNQLARAQERELRSWLYARPVGSQETLASAVAMAAHDVEDLHGIPIDLVATGDLPIDNDGQALVRALRESLLNAVRHGRPPVSAYVEIGQSEIEAFVRDHGDGFDVDEIPDDRLGVRESIQGRMERHGGSARIRRLEQGTEIELRLPRPQGRADA